MFKRLIGLAFAGANPVSWILSNLKLLAVLALLITIGIGAYCINDRLGQNRERAVIIDAQKKEIKHQINIIADQTKQAENAVVGKKAEDEIIVKLDTQQQSNKRKSAAVIEKFDQQVTVIQSNPDITAQAKSAAVAKVTIDTLWDTYCDAAQGAAGCSAGSSAAPPTPTAG